MQGLSYQVKGFPVSRSYGVPPPGYSCGALAALKRGIHRRELPILFAAARLGELTANCLYDMLDSPFRYVIAPGGPRGHLVPRSTNNLDFFLTFPARQIRRP